MATKPNPDLGFFYNKDTPNYWRFFFWLLIDKFSSLKYWAIFFVFCFFTSSIFSTSLDIISKSYNTYQNYSIQKTAEENRIKKELLSSISFEDFSNDIKSINNKSTNLYAKAITSRKALNSSSTKETVNTHYRQINAAIYSDLRNSYIVLTMLQYPSEANYSLLSSTEISEALAVVNSYKNSNRLSALPSVSELLNIISSKS